MFVVTGLHTKRRPHTGTLESSAATTRKPGVDRFNLLPAVSHLHRHPQHVTFSASSSAQAAPRISEPRMTRNDSDKDDWKRNQKGVRTPINVPFRWIAPPRVRRFIPKPLILVERMKARQLLIESSPPGASESRVTPESLTRPKITMVTPLSTLATPPTHRMPTCSTLSSDSHSSSSLSFLLSLRNDVAFGNGFEVIPRVVRPLSVITLGDCSASTDTFVADSPCCVKQAFFEVPLLMATTDVTHAHLDVESGPGEKSVSHTSVPILADFVYRTRQSTDAFEPAWTSTPFGSDEAVTHDVLSPTPFSASATCPTHVPEQTPARGPSDSFQIVFPTSRAVYPFDVPKGAYIVKLPNSGSATSFSSRTCLTPSSGTAMSYSGLTKSNSPLATLANAAKPTLHFRRPSNRAAPSTSPTLVLDGVFALPQPSPSLSSSSSPPPRRTLASFPRPRKPTSRRPLSNTSNALVIVSPSQPRRSSTSPTSLTSSRGQHDSGPESPRSRLAHVLTVHAQLRKQARVPPLVKGVPVSNDLRTQCEIEGLRAARRVVGLGRGAGGDAGGGDGNGKEEIERASLASVGMVAMLRARWEAETGGALR